MMKAVGRCSSKLWVGLLFAIGLTPLGAAQPLKTGGTGAAIGTIEVLAQAYRSREPSFQVSVVPGLGSTGGVKAVAAGALDFALVGRPLKPQERADGLVSHEFGRTPFVIVTNKPGVDKLSMSQLERLIGDDSPAWSDGTPVRLVLRPVSDGDTALLGEFSPGVKAALAAAHARGGMVRAITDQESASESERLEGSLGTSSLGLLRAEKRKLTVVTIDGIAPTLQNYASGAWPHGKTMMIVTKGRPNLATQKFIDFIASDSGRQILVDLGHLVTAAH